MNDIRYLADDERVCREITRLQRTIDNIETVSGRSRRTLQLRDEVARLEALSVYTDVKLRLPARHAES